MLAGRAPGFNAATAGRIAAMQPALGTAADPSGPKIASCP